MRYLLLLVSLFAFVACSSGKEAAAIAELPTPTRASVPTWTPTPPPAVATATATPVPTSASPTDTPSATPLPTELPPTDTSTPTQTPEPQTQAESNINVRGGPGTNYAITGALAAGNPVQPVARNEAGDWLQVTLPDGNVGWVAGWLLTGAPSPESLPIAENIPTPPPPTATTEPPPSTASSSLATAPLIDIGEEIEIKGWRFKVNSIHKRKTVYSYGNPYIAFGHFLVVIIDATNLQSGSDYFARSLPVRAITLPAADVLMSNSKADRYAQWQYDGISSVYSDVNPGVFSRMALAFDIPDDTVAVGIVFDAAVRGPFIPIIEMQSED